MNKKAKREETARQGITYLLNYDPNYLKVTKLVSEAESRRRKAWAGAPTV
jgi:hypothetical protein